MQHTRALYNEVIRVQTFLGGFLQQNQETMALFYSMMVKSCQEAIMNGQDMTWACLQPQSGR